MEEKKIWFRKTSLIDYPGKVAGTMFFPGCNLRCPWCHNRDLVLGEFLPNSTPLDEVLTHLEKRRNVLSGVVLTGGEPTLYKNLPNLIRRIKEIGLSVKLDTNGLEPDALEELFGSPETSPDYIALDLKAAPRRYALFGSASPETCTRKLSAAAVLIRASGIPHEFRTLAFPNGFIGGDDIEALAPLTDDALWYFRPFIPGTCLDPAWDDLSPAGNAAVQVLAQKARALGKPARPGA
ncbi:MAG: anaerobic ribonucleoside-triphosphate reductase activating protein [Spirochaetaceae bacterium]|jgi:pyruvate formate lyase activating enzyme|nr:anaerobic ribonucleoside-triphosphate reductase activating protein [Spirochaetaceae bacterium]